ncbi:DEAD/DEAH box helicase [Nesterenkonia sp.]|uniref:DEAD/DEAH box helicase n=1 Tax=Nesterenkonia sp. TaxID=704201 RepID=UPI00262ADEF0|nr:DEAD/DEAH box helicase [Nesterenkonia sp.]
MNDAAFIVSHDSQGARHRIEAVVASERPGRWYERVVLLGQEDGSQLSFTCTCEADSRCVHVDSALEAAGARLPGLVPGRRQTSEAPQLHIGASTTTGDWFDLQIRVTVDGEEIAFRDLFAALVRGESVYLLPDGRYFSLDTPQLQKLRAVIEEAKELNDSTAESLRISRYQTDLFDELSHLDPAAADQWRHRVATMPEITDPIDPPPGLQTPLRDYQRAGFQWLSRLSDHGLGGVLADDMGLGKTLQTLAMIQRAAAEDPFLVVAPTSVVGNWQAEAQKHTPELDVVVLSETVAKSGRSLRDQVAGADLVITSYALFRLDASGYQELHWAGLVLDEAQMLKNPASRGYRAARDLHAPFTIAITGTPMENNLDELWAIVSLCCPGLLGRRDAFARFYRTPIEKHKDRQALEKLRRRLNPFLLRRTKDQVAEELPAKQEQILMLDLHPEHRSLYDRDLQRQRQKVLGLIEDVGAHRFEILAALNHLRQLALDAELVGYRSIPSAKLEAVGELLPEITAEGHRALVLSQYTRFLTKAREVAERAGVSTSYLDGSTRRRQQVIDQFRRGDTDAFFISLKAGGFGLNLVEADYVLLLDPWWNPAAEEQAIDRTHRIGQHRRVMVYRLVARNTVESKVIDLQRSKRELFRTVLASGDAPDLSPDQLRTLFE